MTCSYLYDYISTSGYDRTVKSIVENLKGVKFDAIVVTGVSGLLFGPTVAYKLGKKLVIVRKQNDSSHSSERIEGEFSYGDKFVILDDLVESASTVLKILEAVDSSRLNTMFVGIYLYSGGYFTDTTNCWWFYKIGDFLKSCNYITYLGESKDSPEIFEFAMKVRAKYLKDESVKYGVNALGIDSYSNAQEIWNKCREFMEKYRAKEEAQKCELFSFKGYYKIEAPKDLFFPTITS